MRARARFAWFAAPLAGVLLVAACAAIPTVAYVPDEGGSGASDDASAIGDGAVGIGPHSISGTVVGLNGSGLVLTDNGGDALAIATNGGPFTFATKVATGSPYEVAVKPGTPTSGGPCTVSGGSGIVATTDVTSVVVNCGPAGSHTVGGKVTGLDGKVVLQDNGGNNLTVTANGAFTFSQPLAPGAKYAVTVLTQPAYPPQSQTCTVTAGTGTMGVANVTNVAVNCAANAFTVGGNMTGATGTLVLLDNNGDPLSLTTDGGFTFAKALSSGSTYAVSVSSDPAGQVCGVSGGNGTIANANVTTVSVTCAAGTDPGIKCGASYCTVGTQACCLGTPSVCDASGSGGCGSVLVTCDDALDCGGGIAVCCAGYNAGNQPVGVACKASAAQCTPPNNGSIELLCDPADAMPCAVGTCTASSKLPGYYGCH